ncbi:Bardet-Biedl syndrome 1 protein-like isoform X2 [Tetranychus urticae]|uniref:Bardet-Biedl syndrome 1 protein-like isoform X2 n=1 Tax=Tetranychus urticae TaxID=32264 RepID=UPI00077B95EB|nr:Bardet-Biedl syndrome 1 protein-like isoform X2 [Tetranychus urticae]
MDSDEQNISGLLDDQSTLDDRRTSSSLSNQVISGESKETLISKPEIASKWLTAYNDNLCSLYTLTACICFVDLNGDGDQKLVIADLGNGVQGMKLNIYKGTFILSQLTLIDCPSGVVSFYMDSNAPRIPAIGVASGSYLYIYKNLKPFYKFGLPSLEIHPSEQDAWNQLVADKIDASQLKVLLENLRIEVGEASLTARSQRLIDLTDPGVIDDFIGRYKDQPLKRSTIITCIATIKKTVDEDNNLNCLIIGTENKDILIIEPDAFTILTSVQLPSIPVFLEISGLFNVEYRVIVSCRDACIYTIKRGFKTGRLCVQLNSQPVGLVRYNNNIIVGTMDQCLSCFTINGNCVWKINQQSGITCLTAIEVEILGLTLIAVALESRTVVFYNGKSKVDTIETENVITSMKFGRYGREDNTLVMVSRSGSLSIRILKRTAKFTSIESDFGEAGSGSTMKMNIPKKTKLFIDQSVREREEAIAIHRAFQQDLYRLRLVVARAYVKAIAASLNPMSSNAVDPLKLSAQVHGLGPVFRLILEIQNTSLDQPSYNLNLFFYCDVKIYRIHRNFIPVPNLQPGYIYTFATKVECVNELNVSDFIKIHVVREGDSTPIITAIINMPSSETPV